MKTIGKIVTIIVISIIVVSTYSIILHFPTLIDAYQNKQYYACLTSSGYSMYPTYNDGSMVVVMKKNHPQFNLTDDDIGIYYNPDREMFIGHRVHSTIDTGGVYTYWFLGDNNICMDEPVQEKYIIGEIILYTDHPVEKLMISNMIPVGISFTIQ